MRVTSFSSIRSAARLLALATAGMLVLLTALVVTSDQAAADNERLCPGPDGTLVYCNDIPGEDDPGEGSSGGTGGTGNEGPSCDTSALEAEFPHEVHEFFCEGENPCWKNDPPVGKWEDEAEWPPPPSPDSGRYIYKYCTDPEGNIIFQDFTWSGEVEEPPLEVQAQTAYGQLVAPSFSLAFSPPQEAVIFVDTWWWAEGAPASNIEGTSAFGLIAVGTPTALEVDPGDGSGTITCGFVTTEGDACSHVYERASDGYPARARLVYDVHFEENGAPVDIPGAPDSFESEWQGAAVPVTEVQTSIVR